MVLIGPGCKLLRGEPVEARMGSVVVIIVTPACNDLALSPFFGPPEGRVFRLFHDGGLILAEKLSNITVSTREDNEAD